MTAFYNKQKLYVHVQECFLESEIDQTDVSNSVIQISITRTLSKRGGFSALNVTLLTLLNVTNSSSVDSIK